MSTLVNRVRRGFYLDSVALMRASRAVSALRGVESASLMIGTAANREILADAGLLTAEGAAAGANDLIVALRASDAAAKEAALGQVEALLRGAGASREQSTARSPRTLAGALRAQPDANLAIISVPGEFAAAEARAALRASMHVMVFSDNVPVEDEVGLKREALARGRLLMGPDCGSAIINGVPLGFANRVPRGGIGIVAGSGTGLQEVSTLIARSDRGVSHAIGTGGRDLSDRVGGITTLMAIDALDDDDATECIVLLSKPPGQQAAARILERIASSPKRFVVCFLGLSDPTLPGNATAAATLRAAATQATGAAAVDADFSASRLAATTRTRGRWIRGLYAGGTLCAEAQLVLAAAGLEVQSNAPVPTSMPLSDERGPRHLLLDLGDDVYTRGRPHPMIDPQARNELLDDCLSDPDIAVVLLDIVLGFGAHDDPAGSLVAALRDPERRRPVLIASVCGLEQDPQVRSVQVAALEAAGILVAPSNAQAAELAVQIVGNMAG